MKKTIMVLICVGAIGLLATASSAALNTTLSNPDFSDPETGGADTFSATVTDWSKGGVGLDFGSIVTKNDTQVPYYTPDAYTSLDQVVGLNFDDALETVPLTGKDLYIYQSIGTVEAGDVGWVYTLSADFNARADWSNMTSDYTINASAFFASGVTGGEAGSTGTLLGTAGVTGDIDHDRVAKDVPAPWIASSDASYTVQVGDVDTEVFAVLRVYVDSFAHGNKGTITSVVDTAVMTVTEGGPGGSVDGDFDADNDVDGVDFGLWQSGFPTASGAVLGDGDADGDGDVDGVDFGLWQANFPFNLGGAATIPEPATLAVLGFGGALMFLRRRKV